MLEADICANITGVKSWQRVLEGPEGADKVRAVALMAAQCRMCAVQQLSFVAAAPVRSVEQELSDAVSKTCDGKLGKVRRLGKASCAPVSALIPARASVADQNSCRTRQLQRRT